MYLVCIKIARGFDYIQHTATLINSQLECSQRHIYRRRDLIWIKKGCLLPFVRCKSVKMTEVYADFGSGKIIRWRDDEQIGLNYFANNCLLIIYWYVFGMSANSIALNEFNDILCLRPFIGVRIMFVRVECVKQSLGAEFVSFFFATLPFRVNERKKHR